MLDLSYYLSGLATVLALFILIVGVRAYRRSRIRIFAYLVAGFNSIHHLRACILPDTGILC